MKRTILSFLCTLALLPAAYACLNDRDSDALAEEARQLPEMVRILTGRFERNPPRYFEMRLERVMKELQKDPNQLALYDDAAVAAERLHKSDQAIALMLQKGMRMGSDKEATYRYHANLGTFLAHRWIARKDRWNKLAELQQAHDHIAKAVEIKPDAHFNRERYQLQVMKWLLTRPQETQKSLGVYLLKDSSKVRQAEGLSGLIVLGAAWESIDVIDALAVSLSAQQHAKLALLATLRRDELLASGRHSMIYSSDLTEQDERKQLHDSEKSGYMLPTVPEGVAAKFTELRREADTWQAERTAYMEVRFAQGKHPDTDPDFWSDWKPTAPPSLEVPGEEQAKRNEEQIKEKWVLGIKRNEEQEKRNEARRIWWAENGYAVVLSVELAGIGLLIAGIYLLVRRFRHRLSR